MVTSPAVDDRQAGRPRILHQQTARDLLLLASRFPVGLFWFVLLVTMVSVGVGTAIIGVGLIILGLVLVITRGGARLERALLGFSGAPPIADPYRSLPPGLLAGLRVRLGDPATYRDILYLLLQFPMGIAALVVLAVTFGLTLGFLAAPFYYRLADGGLGVFVEGDDALWTIDTLPEALVASLIGLVLVLLLPYPLLALATVHRWLGVVLLGRSAIGEAERAAAQAREEQQRSVSANLIERRRIERDLHDGAQQQLVSVAMTLGRAKSKFDSEDESDRDEVRDLMDTAHRQTKAAIVELRNLARGIMPAVLSDRGLDAALSALAQQSQIPVEVRVDVERRLPESVESTAYFVVAEALTNAAKYSRANRILVEVRDLREVLAIEVHDDGRGGVNPNGSGLRGLADRVASIGGTFEAVDGDVTGVVIRAELPCER